MTRIPYAIEQRLRLIDILLDEYGTLNRKVLMAFFGISEAQATRDLRQYKELAPGNMEYDSSAKLYLPSYDFRRVWP